MPIDVKNNGKSNIIHIDDAMRQSLHGTILLDGDNNHVTLEGPPNLSAGFYLWLRNGSQVQIGGHCAFGRLNVYADQGSRLNIGSHVGFNGTVRLQMHEPGSIAIGNGCLFGGDVEISISDMHSLVDVKTSKRINPAKSITIGDRVWIGYRAMIMKGVTIGAGSVIGAGAVVTKSVPEACVAAGNPARVVRTETTWNFSL